MTVGAAATFDALLAAQLAGKSPGHVRKALEIGAQAARAVLEWRQNDGWPATIAPDPTFVLPPFPGLWQPTPPANSAASFTFYSKVKPFALLTATQFLVAAPPTLTSARYAADLNETKRLGSATSTERTADQTLFAQVFAGVNTSIGFFHTGGLPTETRDFHGFWDLADQQARSRIFGGIHFEFESEASQAACVKVPEFTFERFMRPRH